MRDIPEASWLKTIISFPFCVLIFYLCLQFTGNSLVAISNERAAPATGERIKWQVIAGGGRKGSSTNYILSGTAGQTAVGTGTSTDFGLIEGFWQDFAPACMCGDADGSGIFTISDAVFLINYIFAGGPAPNLICLGDADGNGMISISDAVYLINYIFAGGAAPQCP